MSNDTTKKNNYKYGLYLNIRATEIFLINNEHKDNFNLHHLYLLSYFIYLFNEYKQIKDIVIDNERYILINDKLILDQNPIIKYRSRTLKKYIKEIKEFGFIKIEIINNNSRYINICKQFLKLSRNENASITPVSFLMKYEPKVYKTLQNEYAPLVNDYKNIIDNFNDNYNIEDKQYTTKQIKIQLIAYLEKCLENQIKKNNKQPIDNMPVYRKKITA